MDKDYADEINSWKPKEKKFLTWEMVELVFFSLLFLGAMWAFAVVMLSL